MSDAYICLIYLASAKNFLYDKNGMQRQQTVTRISLNISQGQKRDLFWNWCYCTFWVSGEATGVLSLVVSNCFWVESLVSDCMNLKLNTLYHFWDTDLGSKSARLTWAQPYKKIKKKIIMESSWKYACSLKNDLMNGTYKAFLIR